MSTSADRMRYSNKDTVKKGREVIMARGQHDLDLPDIKLFNFFLQRAYTKLTERVIHEIPVSDVLSMLKHTSIARLETSLKKLGNVKIEIDYHQDGKEHSVSCHFLSSDICKAEDGVVKYALDPILLRFLWEPAVYGRINLQFFNQFKSPYGAKLYEILTLYVHRHHRTWTVSVAELRSSLGVPADQYARFDNLKRSVLDKAVAEVNALSGFGVDVEYIRGGRGGKVIEVRFTVTNRPELAQVPNDRLLSNQGRRVRDPNTVDMLDGQTDSERGTQLIITSQTMDEAAQMLADADLPDESVEGFLDDWRHHAHNIQMTDPNINFLRWLRVKLEALTDSTLDDIDDDLVADMLEGL
jgi:hypothetical protein